MLHSIYATLGISYLLYTLRTLLALPLVTTMFIYIFLIEECSRWLETNYQQNRSIKIDVLH